MFACLQLEKFKKSMELLNLLKHEQCEFKLKTADLGTKIKSSSMDEDKELHSQYKEYLPTELSFKTAILACLVEGEFELAMELVEEMKREGFQIEDMQQIGLNTALNKCTNGVRKMISKLGTEFGVEE